MEKIQNIIVYVMGMLEDLVEDGFVVAGSTRLTDEGLDVYEELKKQGFEPTEKEINDCLALLQSEGVVSGPEQTST